MSTLGVLAVVTVLSVTDGDTVKVRIEGCQPAFLCKVDVRILDLDTPESKMPPAKCTGEVVKGNDAKRFAKSLLQPGDRVSARFDHPDKYGGRWNGDVVLPDGRSFRDTMIASRKGRPYDGGKKGSWC